MTTYQLTNKQSELIKKELTVKAYRKNTLHFKIVLTPKWYALQVTLNNGYELCLVWPLESFRDLLHYLTNLHGLQFNPTNLKKIETYFNEVFKGMN